MKRAIIASLLVCAVSSCGEEQSHPVPGLPASSAPPTHKFVRIGWTSLGSNIADVDLPGYVLIAVVGEEGTSKTPVAIYELRSVYEQRTRPPLSEIERR